MYIYKYICIHAQIPRDPQLNSKPDHKQATISIQVSFVSAPFISSPALVTAPTSSCFGGSRPLPTTHLKTPPQ